MSEKKWTPQQQQAIDERGRNLLVSAAAGSGKTAVLSERVAKLVEEGTDLESMLIITFTTAAAAEMRSRILKQVPDPLFSRTHISTFSSLCLEIYREYYHVIGVPPGLAICDDYKQNIFQNEALDEMFEALFESGDREFRDFLIHNCPAKNNETARRMILDLYNFIQSMPDPFEWLDRLASGEFLDEEKIKNEAARNARDKLREAVGCFTQAARMLRNPAVDGVDPMPRHAETVEVYSSKVQSVMDVLGRGDFDRSAAAMADLAADHMGAMRANKKEQPGFDRISEEMKAYREDGKKSVKEAIKLLGEVNSEAIREEGRLLSEQIGILCRLTREFAARYSKKKLDAGLMDFSDADHFALRILEDEHVRAELRDQFDYIFVDEYQDTNYAQEELVSRISRGNNVFMVGDVKQSIYKFRQAEPEIFIGKYKEYSAGNDPHSAAIDLNTNFRSKAPVIDFVNNVFKEIMTERTVGMEYDDRSMLYGGPAAGDGPLYEPELHLISERFADDSGAADEEIEELKAVELEALNAAEVIRKYHKKPVPDGNGTKELEYSDMAVLLRKAKGVADTYYKTFSDMGIPVYLAGGEGYFDTPEIQIFLSFLQITDNPAQDVPLIAAMHFSGTGFSAGELAEIRLGAATDRRSSYYEALRSFAAQPAGMVDEDLRRKAAAFLEKLAGWRKKAAALPLADFIWELLSESGVAGFAMALPGGKQRMANLRAMADRAEAFEQESAEGIGGFVSFMELLASRDSVRTGQASVLSKEDDVVRIMTIHKSKGLEFSFVLLPGLAETERNPDRGALKLHRELGASFKLRNPKTGVSAVPLLSRLIDTRKKREGLAEEIRVLYVALTRAKDIIVMSGAVGDAAKYARSVISLRSRFQSFLNMVCGAVPAKNVILRDRESFTPAAEDPRRADIVRSIRSGFDVDEKAMPVTMEELRARLSFRYEPDPAELLKRKYSVSEIAEHSADALPHGKSGPRIYGRSASDAIARGNAYHKVMEHMPFTAEGKSAEEIAAFMAGLKDKNILSEKEAAYVDPERVAAFFASELGKRACAAEELHKESPFILRTDLDGRSVVVQGVIDCWFREGDGCVLIDYKSSYVDPEDPGSSKEMLAQRYAAQLDLYREALRNIGGMKVLGAYLYLFGSDDWIVG